MGTGCFTIKARICRFILSSALAAGALLVVLGAVQAHIVGGLTRMTPATDPVVDSWNAAVSDDGKVIAFVSDGDFLGEGHPSGVDEIWLYDTVAMSFTRVTSSTDGTREIRAPSLNYSGTVVAFFSDVDFFGEGIPDGQYEIWMYDAVTEVLTRVTTSSGPGRYSELPVVSDDGQLIVFESDADFLNQSIPDEQYEIWLYDRSTMTVTRITNSDDRGSYFPSLSGDGRFVAFCSDADFLGQGISESQLEIWLYDTVALTLTRITSATGSSREPSLNYDGTVIAFRSYADLLNEGRPDNAHEIWLYDTVAMTYTRVTSYVGSGSVRYPRVSDDGTRVAFQSSVAYVGPDIPSGGAEIWLYDRPSGELARVTYANGPGVRYSTWPGLSQDGKRMVFVSDSNFLGQSIPDDQYEVWLWDALELHVFLPLMLRNQ